MRGGSSVAAMNNHLRSLVVGVLAAVVVFGGIQVASAHPLCKRVGATKMQSAKTFKCVKTAGKLVWKVTPTTTTTVASTTTTTVASTTTVVVVPTVSIPVTWLQGGTWPKAVSVTSNVVGTVYLVEGASPVGVVGDITKLPSQYWMKASITQTSTPTVVAIDVEALLNGYYRVYVANTDGLLSAPAVNKVTISITRASSTVVVTVYNVSDTGPGGGIIFYKATTPFACGPTLATTCTYLEAAPSGWSVALAPSASLCAATAGTSTSDPRCAWSGNTGDEIGSTARGTDIGTGYKNTLAIVAKIPDGDTDGKAATASRAYQGGSKDDWFLPSKNELNEMCFYFSAVDKSGGLCNGNAATGRPVGGFVANNYWSSSEYNAFNARRQVFDNGDQDYGSKGGSDYVRPVRAF